MKAARMKASVKIVPDWDKLTEKRTVVENNMQWELISVELPLFGNTKHTKRIKNVFHYGRP